MQHFQTSFLNFLSEIGFEPQLFYSTIFNQKLIKTDNHSYFKLNEVKPDSGIENENLYYEALRNNLKLIQIWEDQWQTHWKIVQSRIKAILGQSLKIHARETDIVKLDNDTLIQFLAENHLSVPIKGKYKFGLIHGNKLVSVISFSYPRNFKAPGGTIKSYEILRFGHLNDHLVVGGLSKLISYFVKNYEVGHLMTYTDNDWGTGDSFLKNGFEKTGRKSKKAFYVDKNEFKRFHYPVDHPGKKTDIIVCEELPGELIKIYNSGSTKFTRYIS